jgi:hypothetical protein
MCERHRLRLDLSPMRVEGDRPVTQEQPEAGSFNPRPHHQMGDGGLGSSAQLPDLFFQSPVQT